MSARKRRQIREPLPQRRAQGHCLRQQQDVGRRFISNPNGRRQQNKGRQHKERMSVWEYGQDIAYLMYKEKAARPPKLRLPSLRWTS
jgi:hypothetical protein